MAIQMFIEILSGRETLLAEGAVEGFLEMEELDMSPQIADVEVVLGASLVSAFQPVVFHH